MVGKRGEEFNAEVAEGAQRRKGKSTDRNVCARRGEEK
jgi:hypothetical protein